MRRLRLPLATVLAALVLTAPARADELVAELPFATPVAAYGGVVAWSAYDADRERFRLIVVERPGAAPVAAPVAPAQQRFDVGLGPDRRGRPVALYTRCTRSRGRRGCDVYRYDVRAGAERRLRLSSRSEDEAWPVQWGTRVAFVRRHRNVARDGEVQPCDVPFVKDLAAARPARRLDRGSCGLTTGMSIRRARIVQVTFGTPPDATRYDSQVRLLSAHGGALRLLARQGSGEESNVFGSPSQSAGAVHLTRSGVNPRPMFVRIDLRSGRKREVRAHTGLSGPLARDDGGDLYYVEGSEICMAYGPLPCRLVRTTVDPFSARPRTLLPRLTIALRPGAGEPPKYDEPYVLTGRLTRAVVGAGRLVRSDPLAGVPVELVAVELVPSPGGDVHERFRPTGVLVTTDAAGGWSHTVSNPGPAPWFTAATRSPAVAPTFAGRGIASAVEARITLAVSETTFGGAVAPGQPGRTVRIQRLASRSCGTSAGGRICDDRWTTVASAPLTGAGTGFAATVAAPEPGTYRAALPYEERPDAPGAYSGFSGEVTVGG